MATSLTVGLALAWKLSAAPTVEQSGYALIEVCPLARQGPWYSFGTGLSARGEVTGYAEGGPDFPNPLRYSFIYSNGALQPVPVPTNCFIMEAKAINGRGEVVGHASVHMRVGTEDMLVGQAFLYSQGRVITFGDLEARANAINDRGQVVGRSSDRAFLYSEGRLMDLGTLGGDASEARAINNAGQIVGGARTASGRWRAFLYQDGQMRDLGTLGGSSSDAYGINAQGKVVGWARTANGQDHAFLWSEGRMVDLGTLGGDSSQATAINDHDIVVGYSRTADGRVHAFVWSRGTMRDLDSLIATDWVWEPYRANGINNAGQIVGTGYYESPLLGRRSPAAFLLTPRPVLLDPAVRDTTFWFSVRPAPATWYVLEWTDRLPATNWTAVLEFVGDGTVQTLSRPVTAAQRFYRLRLQ